MEKGKLISVIIPVYNVEKYLDRCMKSVINQTYENLEIILVDDGSTDNSGKMCDEYVYKDKRIKVTHKKNNGLGMARNSGLSIAKGEYVAFVDSDDEVALDMYSKLYYCAEKNKTDICYCGCTDILNDKRYTGIPPLKLKFQGREVYEEFVVMLMGSLPENNDSLYTGGSVCSSIYRKSLIVGNNILFYSEKEKYISEDLIFNIDVCKFAKSITILPESLYYYYKRAGSLTTSYREDRFEKGIVLYNKLKKEAEEIDILDLAEVRMKNTFLHYLISCVKTEVQFINKNAVKKTYNNIKEICNNSIVKEILRTFPIELVCIKQKIFLKCIKRQYIYIVIGLSWLKIKLSKI